MRGAHIILRGKYTSQRIRYRRERTLPAWQHMLTETREFSSLTEWQWFTPLMCIYKLLLNWALIALITVFCMANHYQRKLLAGVESGHKQPEGASWQREADQGNPRNTILIIIIIKIMEKKLITLIFRLHH